METFKANPLAVELAKDMTFEELISSIHEYSRELGALAMFVHAFNVKMGWWPDAGRNFGDLNSLVHTEISEGYEAHRRGDIADDKLPRYRGIDVEWGADALLRILDTLGSRQERTFEDLGEVFQAKVEFNATRADHKPENRVKEGGKRL